MTENPRVQISAEAHVKCPLMLYVASTGSSQRTSARFPARTYGGHTEGLRR